MEPESDTYGYSIAAVSKLTGVSCHALRVWERRYGFPNPGRSAANQRRYGIDEVNILRMIAELARSGRPIGEVIAAHKAGKIGPSDAEADPARPSIDSVATTVVDLLFAGDVESADDLIGRKATELGPVGLIGSVLEPALIEVGERWFRRSAGVFQEHLATGILLRALGRILDDARRSNARPIHRALVAALQGDRHEGGVLIVSIMLELSGWRALVLGVDIPVAELRKAVDLWHPDAIGLSFVLSRNIKKRFDELDAVRDMPIFVGGRSLMNYRTLARRHGLVPLTGPISIAIPQWAGEFARRTRSGSGTTCGS